MTFVVSILATDSIKITLCMTRSYHFSGWLLLGCRQSMTHTEKMDLVDSLLCVGNESSRHTCINFYSPMPQTLTC